MYEDWIKSLTSIFILCLDAFQFECLLELWDTYLVPVSMANFLSVKLIVHLNIDTKLYMGIVHTEKVSLLHKVVYPIVL